MKNKPLKVGFDLDGVILYNPVRVMRPLITNFKRRVLKKKKTRFYVPRSKVEQGLWWLIHQSSLFIVPGYDQVKELVAAGAIEAYLVTGRFACLKADLDRWLKKLEGDVVFSRVYYNRENLQPHDYKKTTIKSLDLDFFIEDNWDIVESLQDAYQKKEMKTKVYWLYNVADKQIAYPYKVPSLKDFVEKIRRA